MKALTYNDQKITVLRQTDDPLFVIQQAIQITTNKPVKDIQKAIKFLLTANHTSLFEHLSMTMFIENVSRSFLAQITRHRMSSFTTGSQHYQDYRNYPIIISPNLEESDKDWYESICNDSIEHYRIMVDVYNQEPEEARQVLPNAMAVNILWTINARSLINFLNLRLCKRNTLEMQIFAFNLKHYCIEWFPDLFIHVGADCFMTKCRQGAMACKKE